MTNAALTKPRTLNHAATMRIINSARTDWQTWLAACLFPFKLYVALAFVAILKLKVISPGGDFGFGSSDALANSLIVQLIASGYFLSLLILSLGALIQAKARSYRAAIGSGCFALAALIIGVGGYIVVSGFRVYY